VNRDNALFLVLGILVGVVAAYPLFETMSSRQPALRLPGQVEAGATPNAGSPSESPPAGGGGAPAMQQIQQLREYVEANPNDADALLTLAQLNLSINDLIRARTLYERYVKLRPEDTGGVLTLANLYFDTREFAQAKDRYLEVLEREPRRPEVLTDLGVCFRNLGDPQRAVELFRQARALQPDMPQALYNEALVLAVDLADFDTAAERLARLREIQPGNAQVEELAREIERRRSR
jgi:tetratricopeptide (TPR) repeat protein